MLRRPLRQAQAEGLQIERRESFKPGMVERLAARKPASRDQHQIRSSNETPSS